MFHVELTYSNSFKIIAIMVILSLPLAIGAIVIGARIWFAVRPGKAKRLRCCVHCGYDLRITPNPVGPTARRCPECGELNEFQRTATLP